MTAGAILWAMPGAAQLTPAPAQVPGLPSRGQIEQPAPPAAAPSTARVSGRDAVPTPPCPLAASPLKVRIDSVRFVAVGRDAVPAAITDVLAGIAPPQTGEQPIAVVCTIRDTANAALAKAGFVASVQVPPQKISDGTLLLSVVLARVTEVRVHGDAGRYRSVLAGAIARLRTLDPLNERDAERLLLLAGDVPGLDIQLSLRPAGGAPGDVIGDLTIVTQRATVLANLQNYGSQALGRETGYARIDLNAVFLPDDTLYLGGSTTGQLREQQVAQFGYRVGQASSGFTAGPRLTYAWSRPDVGALDLRSRSLIAGFDISQPLVRSVRDTLSLAFGFELIEQKIRVHDDNGSSPLNLDKLREAYVRVDGRTSARRPDGLDAYTIGASVEARRGMAILGASRRGTLTASGYAPSRFEGDPEAFVVRGNLNTLARIDGRFSLSQAVMAQWADHPLLNFDEQALGNLTVGLGYDPGANSGDRFVGSHAEGRFDFRMPRGMPVQLFAFTDAVWIWNLDSFSTENDRLLRSVGGGFRARLPGPMLLEMTYARPLDRALSINERRAAPRLLFSLTAQISPK